MGFLDRLVRGRAGIDAQLQGWDLHHYSPATLGQHTLVTRALAAHARGRIIDLGAGNSPYRGLLATLSAAYDTLDIAPRHDDLQLTYIGDVQSMPQVPSGAYDTVVCLEVLEHVPRPWQAMAEISRILAPGGTAVISVPHLSRIHEAPHDYLRYTSYGLAELAAGAGLEVEGIEPRGGLFAFLGHQYALVAITLLGKHAFVRHAAAWALYVTVALPCLLLDRLVFGSGVFALGYVAVLSCPLVAAADSRQNDPAS